MLHLHIGAHPRGEKEKGKKTSIWRDSKPWPHTVMTMCECIQTMCKKPASYRLPFTTRAENLIEVLWSWLHSCFCNPLFPQLQLTFVTVWKDNFWFCGYFLGFSYLAFILFLLLFIAVWGHIQTVRLPQKHFLLWTHWQIKSTYLIPGQSIKLEVHQWDLDIQTSLFEVLALLWQSRYRCADHWRQLNCKKCIQCNHPNCLNLKVTNWRFNQKLNHTFVIFQHSKLTGLNFFLY